VKIPFIESNELLDVVEGIDVDLTKAEQLRNKRGKVMQYVPERSDEDANSFETVAAGKPKRKTSRKRSPKN